MRKMRERGKPVVEVNTQRERTIDEIIVEIIVESSGLNVSNKGPTVDERNAKREGRFGVQFIEQIHLEETLASAERSVR